MFIILNFKFVVPARFRAGIWPGKIEKKSPGLFFRLVIMKNNIRLITD